MSTDSRGRAMAMIVDDSRAMRMILRRTLTELGYAASEAGNGQGALDLLAREGSQPSLMLVDWNMPVMCGLDLVKAVRADGRYAGITLIMVTTRRKSITSRRRWRQGPTSM